MSMCIVPPTGGTIIKGDFLKVSKVARLGVMWCHSPILPEDALDLVSSHNIKALLWASTRGPNRSSWLGGFGGHRNVLLAGITLLLRDVFRPRLVSLTLLCWGFSRPLLPLVDGIRNVRNVRAACGRHGGRIGWAWKAWMGEKVTQMWAGVRSVLVWSGVWRSCFPASIVQPVPQNSSEFIVNVS